MTTIRPDPKQIGRWCDEAQKANKPILPYVTEQAVAFALEECVLLMRKMANEATNNLVISVYNNAENAIHSAIPTNKGEGHE